MSAPGGIKTFSALSSYLNTSKNGQACFVDTSILFSVTYDSDAFNSESEMAFDLLAEADFSVFTNVNVRSEFLENHRRVLIPEILIDLLTQKGSQIDPIFHEKLKSHRTSYQKKVAEEKNTKMDPIQIKMWRRLLLEYSFGGVDGWTLFCRDFLKGKIHRI